MKHLFASAALLGVLASAASAQISYSVIGSTYTETFTNPAGWGNTTDNITLTTWTDNTTVAGWYASYWVNGASYTTPGTLVQSNVGFQNTTNSLYMFKANTGDITDGALGAFPVGTNVGTTVGAGGVFYGVQIANDTGSAITSFDLDYALEIWRSATNSNTITVSFSTDATSLSTGTWTSIDNLTITVAAAASALSLNGNSAANRTISSTVSVTLDTAVASGSSIWIRWYDVNSTGTDAGLGIDDVRFTAASSVPEPSAFAGLAGLAALGLVASRRRARR